VSLTDTGVQFSARVEHQYQGLITSDSQFWLSGADLSLKGIKNLSRLVTGSVINVLPGTQASDKAMQFELASEAPDLLTQAKLKLTVVANTHTGVSNGAQVRYKQLPIGQITSINLSKDFSTVEYQIEILPEFKNLLTKGSFFIPESALAVDASLAGIKVKTRDVTTMLEGAISLIPSNSATLIAPNSTLPLHESIESAQVLYAQQQMTHFTLTSIDGADLTEGSPIYYKKMQIGSVNKINWFAKTDKFNIDISIDNKFVALVKANTVFWRNDAVAINASLAGVDINVAPLKGAINGSIALGHIDETANPQITQPNLRLYDTKSLALMQAKVINLILPVSTKVAEKAAIRYQGHKIGEISHVKLNQDLTTINAQAYIYGQYANHFSASDSEYFIVDAQISLAGINAPETLLTGPYIGVIPGNSLELVDSFVAQPHANFEASVPKDALSFQLVDDQLGSIKVGTPLFFRGIKVGQIDGYQLDKSGIEITLFAHVNAEYSHLINQSSQFWDASGIKLDIGLFSGAQLETGSLETILAGGIAFATHDTTSGSNGIDATSRFPLHKNMQDEWIQWQPLQTK
jgi:paraquat-inducible protein B